MKEKKFNGKTLDEYLEKEISDFEVEVSRKLKEIFDFYAEGSFGSGVSILDYYEERDQDKLMNMLDDLVEYTGYFIHQVSNTFFNFLGEEKKKLIKERLESIKEKITEIADKIRDSFEDYKGNDEEYTMNQQGVIDSIDYYIDELRNCDIIKEIKGKLKGYIKDE